MKVIDKEYPKLLEKLKATDILDRIDSVMNKDGRMHYFIDGKDGKIKPIPPESMDINSPWNHTHQDPDRACRLYHLMFDCMEFIPSKCLKCWKVVARPRTVKELIAVTEVQVELGKYGKAGIEERPYVHGLYGAYWYCNSKEEGMERHREVREAISREVSPDVPVILKRYCTEFEIKLGPSSGYNPPMLAKYWEKRFEELVEFPGKEIPQPQYLKDHVMLNWLRFAYVNGDSTALEFNEGQHFVSTPVTYHDKEE